jgi:hypothetical protein
MRKNSLAVIISVNISLKAEFPGLSSTTNLCCPVTERVDHEYVSSKKFPEETKKKVKSRQGTNL